MPRKKEEVHGLFKLLEFTVWWKCLRFKYVDWGIQLYRKQNNKKLHGSYMI